MQKPLLLEVIDNSQRLSPHAQFSPISVKETVYLRRPEETEFTAANLLCKFYTEKRERDTGPIYPVSVNFNVLFKDHRREMII